MIDRWGRVYGCVEPVDMRKSFDGLIGSVRQLLKGDPLSGDLFVFINRERTILKCLWWDRTGWCVLGKRVSRASFQLRGKELRQELTAQEFYLLLDGMLKKKVQFSENRTIATV